MIEKVFAVVVTYYPERGELFRLLRSLQPQVARIVLVDNTPGGSSLLDAVPGDISVVQLRQGRNLGIAEALNIGIRYALEHGCSHVLLSDQDSEPAAGMVGELLHAARELAGAGHEVAAVGPNLINETVGSAFKFQHRTADGRFGRRKALSDPHKAVEVVSLITSGTLVSAEALQRIGLMRAEFFIDFVDIEWCLRAAAHGMRCYVVPQAKMQHRMGGAALQVWLFGWRSVSKYGPLRLYYQFRNSAYLARQHDIPLGFRISQIPFWLAKLYAYGLFSDARAESIRMMASGWLDGMKGRLRARHEGN